MNEHKQPWTNTFDEVIDQITKQPKHTQGPWKASGQYVITENSNIAHCTAIKGKNTKQDIENINIANANAAFIVRACNAHDDLLDALKLVCTMYERTTGLPTPSQALRAIAKAEGGV